MFRKSQSTELLAKQIYTLATEKNTEGLAKLFGDTGRENFLYPAELANVTLATENNNDGVMFLSDLLSDVNNSNSDIDIAVGIYAQAGNTEKVAQLLEQGAKINTAGWGFAAGGHADQVEFLVLKKDANLFDVEHGLKDGGIYQDQEKLLEFLSHIQDKDLREEFYPCPFHTISNEDFEPLVFKATDINSHMKQHQLSYQQALKFHEAKKVIDQKFPINLLSKFGFNKNGELREKAISATLAELKGNNQKTETSNLTL